MSQEHRHDPRSLRLGLIAAVLALLGQIALGAAIPGHAARSTPSARVDGFPICHSEVPDTTGGNAPADHDPQGMDCALCRICSASNAPAFLPVPAPPPAPPIALVARRTPHPPAHGPPVAVILAAAYPTGPPFLA